MYVHTISLRFSMIIFIYDLSPTYTHMYIHVTPKDVSRE